MKTITLQISDKAFDRLNEYLAVKKVVLGHDRIDGLFVRMLSAIKCGYTSISIGPRKE